jgi:predicted nucleic acid-binding protein
VIAVVDTHTLLWYVDDNSRLSRAAGEVLDAVDAEVVIPAISLFEIEHSHRRGRLPFSAEVAAARILSTRRVRFLSSGRWLLPFFPAGLEMHDAIIVATALHLQAQHPDRQVALLTADQAIRDSGLVNCIW